MSDEINTYLSISENKYEIFLFDKSNSKNLYKEVIEVKDKSKEIKNYKNFKFYKLNLDQKKNVQNFFKNEN